MSKHLYTPLYRPPSSFALPKGWTLVERPSEPGFEKRTDLPLSSHHFGVVEYSRALTSGEIADFQLLKVEG